MENKLIPEATESPATSGKDMQNYMDILQQSSYSIDDYTGKLFMIAYYLYDMISHIGSTIIVLKTMEFP